MTVYLKKKAFEELIARKNMSQDEAARILGVSRGYLSMLKDRKKYCFSPSPELREKLMKLLSAKFDDIFFIPNARFNEHRNSRPLADKGKRGANTLRK